MREATVRRWSTANVTGFNCCRYPLGENRVAPAPAPVDFFDFSLDFSLTVRLCYALVDEPKQNAAVLIAASLVAAIRLRGEPIRPSPKLNAVIHDSIMLAQLILAQIERRG